MREPDVLTVEETLRRLKAHLKPENTLAVRLETLGVPIGPTPSVPIIGFHHGIDWDNGKLFFQTHKPLCLVGEDFRKEQEIARSASKLLGWVYYVANGILDDHAKITEIRRLLKEPRDRS